MLLREEFFLPRVFEAAEPYMTGPTTVFLGGSQVINDGAYATPGSDYDILVVGKHIKHPTSITAPIGHTKFDIILRDPETLAYDFDEALRNGKGTLLHLCHFGKVIHDDLGYGPSIAAAAQDLYTKGPLPVTEESALAECKRLLEDIEDAAQNGSSSSQGILALVIAYRIGGVALRISRRWGANGKILGRFLLEHLPSIKTNIEEAFNSAVQGDFRPYTDLVSNTLLNLHEAGPPEQSVPFYTEGREIRFPQNDGDAFTCVRTCPDVLYDYWIAKENSSRKNAARTWLQIKYQMADQAVTPDRIGRPSNEYFYAVARLVNYLISADMLRCGQDPHDYDLCDRARLWAHTHPSGPSAVKAALAGDPSDLRALGRTIQQNLIGADPTGPLPPRISSAKQRVSPKNFFDLSIG